MTDLSMSARASARVDEVPASPSADTSGVPGPQPGAPLFTTGIVLTIQIPSLTPDPLLTVLRAIADDLTAHHGVDNVILEVVRACHVCGCTDDQACFGGCWWVNAAGEPDLCSACAAVGAGSGR